MAELVHVRSRYQQRRVVDQRAKRLRALSRRRSARRAEGRFVIEGATSLGVALDAGIEVDLVVVEPERLDDASVDVLDRVDADVVEVPPGTLAGLVDTRSPPPVAATGQIPHTSATAIAEASLVLVAVEIADPGNLGTLLRSAEAAGADALVVAGTSVDPWSPKVVRSSAGAAFLVPVFEADIPDAMAALGAAGVRRFATDAVRGTPHDEVDLTGRVALVLGNEAHGLPGSVGPYVDEWVRIPLEGRTESLNVAMAGSVLAFEVARQRRQATVESGGQPS